MFPEKGIEWESVIYVCVCVFMHMQKYADVCAQIFIAVKTFT